MGYTESIRIKKDKAMNTQYIEFKKAIKAAIQNNDFKSACQECCDSEEKFEYFSRKLLHAARAEFLNTIDYRLKELEFILSHDERKMYQATNNTFDKLDLIRESITRMYKK